MQPLPPEGRPPVDAQPTAPPPGLHQPGAPPPGAHRPGAHPLAVLITEAAGGRYPAPDGSWRRVLPWRPGLEGIVAFTGHAVLVVAPDVSDARIIELGANGLGGAHDPRLVAALAGPDGWIDSLDVLLAGRGTGEADRADPRPGHGLGAAGGRAGSGHSKAGSADGQAGSADSKAGSADSRAGSADGRAGSADGRAGSAAAAGPAGQTPARGWWTGLISRCIPGPSSPPGSGTGDVSSATRTAAGQRWR